MRLAFESSPQCGWAPSNPLGAWTEREAEEGRVGSLPACLLPNLGHWSSVLGLGFTLLRGSSHSKAFGLGLELHHGFLGSLACRWQIVGLLSHRNPVSWFLTSQSPFIDTCVHPIVSTSLWRSLGIDSHFIFSHSREYTVVSHCGLFAFP